ncbi:hypothetical protein V6N12_071942 [Hibiscus sabdariffa]|uniref:Piwi domain-containing protein n=1 Tax=Hibiscus sabdariffa TaxID=183260 RepID=A0ABR2FL80_9ROSI
MGGRNNVLLDALSWRVPLVSDIPTIIFGADVTHPESGEDCSPSIAAVSCGLTRLARSDKVCWPGMWYVLSLIVKNLFKTWQDPQRGTVAGGMIRDGVSEGQFYQVLFYELDAIRKACASLEPTYQPPVTFIVVQKRHHTRLFANNHSDRSSTDKSGNILPGTVVDSKICHPTEFDFYLCSHAGIQVWFRITNWYAWCTRSVSVVPPAYYAHLAAYRARFYIEPEASKNGRTRCTRTTNGSSVWPLPALKEKLKNVMFYC